MTLSPEQRMRLIRKLYRHIRTAALAATVHELPATQPCARSSAQAA